MAYVHVYGYIIVYLFLITLNFKLFLNCRSVSLTKPYPELLCEPEKHALMNDTYLYHCILECMRRDDCWALSYHKTQADCILALEPCTVMETHPEYEFIQLGDTCISWEGHTDGQAYPSGMVSGSLTAVARLNGYVSCLYFQDDTAYGVINGEQMLSRSFEVLVVNEQCATTWEPYTAGDALPSRAVQSVDPNGDTTNVARAWHSTLNGFAFSHYVTGASLMYYESYGVQSTDTMDILVLV